MLLLLLPNSLASIVAAHVKQFDIDDTSFRRAFDRFMQFLLDACVYICAHGYLYVCV